MLSRTADSLYWMARYIERAGNLARTLQVADRMSIVARKTADNPTEWHSALVTAATEVAYYNSHDRADRDGVIDYLALDRNNPSSIISCFEAARASARAVRAALTSDMWDVVNGTWLDLQSGRILELRRRDLSAFLDWVRERTVLFSGTADSGMLRNDAFYFVNLGTHIERADSTARILDVKYHILLEPDQEIGGGVDYHQWAAVLRAVSALRAYHWIYRDRIKPWQIAELLILRPEMPRSLLSCMGEVKWSLDKLAADYGWTHECQRSAGWLHSRLTYRRIDDIYQSGLHEFLREFIDKTGELSNEIARAYLF